MQGVAKGVAGAASNVAGVIPGRKELHKHASKEDKLLDEAHAKLSVHVKGTPRKDEKTTRMLSVKHGELSKKNDQGQWHTVQACIVPVVPVLLREPRRRGAQRCHRLTLI